MHRMCAFVCLMENLDIAIKQRQYLEMNWRSIKNAALNSFEPKKSLQTLEIDDLLWRIEALIPLIINNTYQNIVI